MIEHRPPSSSTFLSRSRLAMRLAVFPTVGSVLVVALLMVLGGGSSWWSPLIVGLVVGVLVFATVQRVVTPRLMLAQEALRNARKRRFDLLPSVRVEHRDDDLDHLLWQVYHAGRVLKSEFERLERLENYRRDFIGNVSHELKTPIFVIGGFAEQLLDGGIDDPAVNRRFLQKILRNSHRLQQLSQDLITISRLESGETQIHKSTFAVAPLVNEVIDALEPVADLRGVKLRSSVPPDLPGVISDREMIRQVLTNLIDNAIKYSNEDGRAEVSARLNREDGRSVVHIEVADDGIGIQPEDIDRITERFYRIDRSRSRRQGGTGLGLAIVKHVLEAHGSRLHVDSRPGAGSTFAFDLTASDE